MGSSGCGGVHPCVGRADAQRTGSYGRPVGSSLRVQGGRNGGTGLPGTGRFIPARAGRTPVPAPWGWPGAVHPCACRADQGLRASQRAARGSSLRVQGGRADGADEAAEIRFIPARAGRTCCPQIKMQFPWVHPCACRADVSCAVRGRGHAGSSLRVQGGHPPQGADCLGSGFIPARAGRTPPAPRGQGRRWVHPCACRADDRVVRELARIAGSSLRVQGGPAALPSWHAWQGFIPARAGRTSSRNTRQASSTVHPCACRADASTRPI